MLTKSGTLLCSACRPGTIFQGVRSKKVLRSFSSFPDSSRICFQRSSFRRGSVPLQPRRDQFQSFVTSAKAAATVQSQQAEDGDYVKVHYTGTLDDGTQFDSSKERDPLEFVIGAKTVISGFDKAVKGLSVGESRKEDIAPEDGYGEWNKNLLVKIPAKEVPDDLDLQEGQRVRLGNGAEATVHQRTDEDVTIDANHVLAGKTLHFDVELLDLTKASSFTTATFGGGCFWGPDLKFARVPGVLDTEVGYSQGTVPQPSYEDVCSGLTGHNEVVKVTYDPSKVSYRDLLEAFLEGHNPTQVNGQGNDSGSQYRGGIYTHNPEQKKEANAFVKELQSRYKEPIATEVEELNNYHPAEDYHQKYLARGGRFGRPQSAQKGCTDPIRCYG